jgi:peptidoglycan/xylan/chitin deacetylase (PgdA/CDA1 family)
MRWSGKRGIMAYKHRIKKFCSQAASTFGLLEGLSRLRLHNQAFILMYHRVVESPDATQIFIQPGMYVHCNTFQQHMRYVHQHFNVISLAELVNRLESGKKVGGCCAITFDDGWQDNFTNAFPVLQRLGLPATIFLATDYMGSNRLFWPETISYYLRHPDFNARASKHPALIQLFAAWVEQKDKREKSENVILDDAIARLKTLAPSTRERIIDFLQSFLGPVPPQERLLLKWEQIRKMHSSGIVDFGSHTAGHVILTQVPLAHARDEIRKSRTEIEHQIGTPPSFFAYPNGNYTQALISELKSLGFVGAVTTRRGRVGSATPMHEMPRIGMHEDVGCTVSLFRARLLLDQF